MKGKRNCFKEERKNEEGLEIECEGIGWRNKTGEIEEGRDKKENKKEKQVKKEREGRKEGGRR